MSSIDVGENPVLISQTSVRSHLRDHGASAIVGRGANGGRGRGSQQRRGLLDWGTGGSTDAEGATETRRQQLRENAWRLTHGHFEMCVAKVPGKEGR